MSETETLERPKGKAKEAAPGFLIERDAFLAAVRTVGQVVEARNTIPILSNLLLEAEAGGMLKIRGTDLNMMAEVIVPCDCRGSFATTAEDFPPLVLDDASAEFEMAAKDLLALLDPASVAMSTEEVARAYLCGVFLHAPDATSLRAVATDGNQLVRVIAAQPEGAGKLPPVILSRKTVNTLRRLLDANDDCQVIVRADENRLSVAMGRTTLISKVVDGTFPDYNRMIPRGNDKILKVHAAEFRRCLSAAAGLAETRGKARHIIFELSPEECQARAASNAGAVLDPLDAEFPHEALPIALNEKLAGPLIGIFGEAAQLDVAIAGTAQPIVITSPTKPTITAVLGTMSV